MRVPPSSFVCGLIKFTRLTRFPFNSIKGKVTRLRIIITFRLVVKQIDLFICHHKPSSKEYLKGLYKINRSQNNNFLEYLSVFLKTTPRNWMRFSKFYSCKSNLNLVKSSQYIHGFFNWISTEISVHYENWINNLYASRNITIHKMAFIFLNSIFVGSRSKAFTGNLVTVF